MPSQSARPPARPSSSAATPRRWTPDEAPEALDLGGLQGHTERIDDRGLAVADVGGCAALLIHGRGTRSTVELGVQRPQTLVGFRYHANPVPTRVILEGNNQYIAVCLTEQRVLWAKRVDDFEVQGLAHFDDHIVVLRQDGRDVRTRRLCQWDPSTGEERPWPHPPDTFVSAMGRTAKKLWVARKKVFDPFIDLYEPQ